VFLGIHKDDRLELCEKAVRKLLNLRLFSDEKGKMNCSVRDVEGGILLVSQFTLYGDCRKGNRPSFIEAMPPAEAKAFYDYFCNTLRDEYAHVAFGEFGADMKVALINSGPVTLSMELLSSSCNS
jgi:D-tyrosyl-tRNA(Tyr) deacylase